MAQLDDFAFLKSLFKNRNCKESLSEFKQTISSKKGLTEEDLGRFCKLILLNCDDLAKRQIILCFFQEFFNKRGIPCKLYFFGSTINGVGFYNSDMDIYMQILGGADGNQLIKSDPSVVYKTLSKLRGILYATPLNPLYKPFMVRAKCPIIKLSPVKGNPKLPSDLMAEFDFNASHPLGVFNSAVINCLITTEPRLQSLFAILKNWAKLNDLIVLSGFSSYSIVFLVVFFLQNCEPSFMKSLDLIYEYSLNFCEVIQPDFEKELNERCALLLQHIDQMPSTPVLIHQFFTFYCNFDFVNYVISPRLGYAIRKDHYMELMTHFDNLASIDFRLFTYICVEDPFELDRNIAAKVQTNYFVYFVRLCNWYAKKPQEFLNNGSNFAKFISTPLTFPNKPNLHCGNVNPCICFTLRHFNDLTRRKFNGIENRTETDLETEQNQYIKALAKESFEATVTHLTAQLADGKFKGKLEVTEHSLLPDTLFSPKAENSATNESSPEADNNLKSVNLASIQIKLLNQPKQMRKKRKLDQLTADDSNIMPSLAELSKTDALNSELSHPLVNGTLQCQFLSGKSFFLTYKFDQFIPKWIGALLSSSARKICTCNKEEQQEEKEETVVEATEVSQDISS